MEIEMELSATGLFCCGTGRSVTWAAADDEGRHKKCIYRCNLLKGKRYSNWEKGKKGFKPGKGEMGKRDSNRDSNQDSNRDSKRDSNQEKRKMGKRKKGFEPGKGEQGKKHLNQDLNRDLSQDSNREKGKRDLNQEKGKRDSN